MAEHYWMVSDRLGERRGGRERIALLSILAFGLTFTFGVCG